MNHPFNGLDLMFFIRHFLICHDFSVISIKEVRELIMLLLLSEFGVLTKEQVHLLIMFTDCIPRSHSKNSLSSIASRLCKLDSFKTIKKNNVSFITFSRSGSAKMIESLKKLFSYLHLTLGNYTSEEYLLERATRTFSAYSVKPHSIFINTTIIFSVFLPFPKDTAFYIRKEMKIPSPYSSRNTYGKNPDDIYPDIIYIPSRTEQSVCAIEVDLGTEDINSVKSGAILPKIEAYTRIYNRCETDVFFLFENPDVSYIVEKNRVLRNGYKVLNTVFTHRSFTREILYLKLITSLGQEYNKYSDFPLTTINDLLNLMQSKDSSSCLSSHSIENTFLFEMLIEIAKYVDSDGNISDIELALNDRGKLPLNELFPFLEDVKETLGSKSTELFTKNDSKRLALKRKNIYKTFMNSYLNVTNLGRHAQGVLAGMVLVLSCNSRLWKKFPYIYFNETVKSNLGTIIHNLGIVDFNEKVTNFQLVRPLIVDCPPNKYRNSLSLLSMRNTFRVGDIDICIENISEDLGALYRVQSYLKLPYGTRPNTLVIALVDQSDYILANGETLQSGSIFYLPGNNGVKNTPICSGEYAYWPYMKARLDKFVRNNALPDKNHYLPLALDQTQELVFLSYHDWDKALNTRVTPWIYDHEDDRLVPRKHLLRDHKIEPHLLSKHKNSYFIHDWK